MPTFRRIAQTQTVVIPTTAPPLRAFRRRVEQAGVAGAVTPLTIYNDLFEAVTAAIQGNTLCSALLNGGVYGGRGGSQVAAAKTWAVVVEVGEDDDYDSIYDYRAKQIQVSVFAPTRTLATAAGRAVKLAIQDAPLVTAEGGLLHIRQISRFCDINIELGKAANNSWHEARTFEAMLSATLS